ncbi:protein OXIDATIVE STRESS 3-like [Typha angustifolia]|uniref:protein OXIDATIVE STRESS 3-like n=1 Tax=Typha angustifolia TaxID=59011 RepID=UPI003C2B32FD
MDHASMDMHGIMSEEEEDSVESMSSSLGSFSMDSSSTFSDDDDDDDDNDDGPLYEMSNLIAQLPLKRGISMFYQGKSQSFTSLSTVRSSEDLPKPERPCKKKKKKLKSSKSYGGGLDKHKSLGPKGCSKTIAKKAPKGSLSSLLAKRHNYVAGRHPISQSQQRSSNLCNHALLFA